MIAYNTTTGVLSLSPATYLIIHKTDIAIVSNINEPVFGVWKVADNSLSQESQDVIDSTGSKLGKISGEGTFPLKVEG